MKQLDADLFNKRYMLVSINHYNIHIHEREFFCSAQEAMEFFQKHSHNLFIYWENPHVMEVVKKIGTVKPVKRAEYKLVSPAEPGEYTIAPLQLPSP